LLQPVLAPLLLTSVTREEAGLLQRRPGLGIERDESARDAESDRTGLPAHPAAAERGVDVVDLFGLGDAQRLLGDDLMREDREVLLELTAVDRDHARAGPQPYARDGVLAPAGGL